MFADTQPLDDDREDGELEDGEIDDDDGEAPGPPSPVPAPAVDHKVPTVVENKSQMNNHHTERSSHDNSHSKHDQTNHHSGQSWSDHEDSGNEKDDKGKHRKRNKSRKKRPRDREREREKDDRKKKRKKNRRYVDHDRVGDDDFNSEWVGDKKQHRSPRGPYESPSQENGGPNGPYENSYASPPGLYDSPSDEDGYGPPPKLKRMDSLNSSGNGFQQSGGRGGGGGGSMMSMLGDDYMDANVAANENEDMFVKGNKNQFTQERKRQRKEKAKHYRDLQRQREQQQPRKRTLAETPMDERPFCKFFMDGKCNKGHDCPFNHDFQPPTKLEVCKFYLNDACTKGAHCLYMHGEFPCKFFHNNGTCANGDDCKFSHEELNDDGHKIMDRLNYGENSGFDPFADDANNMVEQPLLQSPRKKVSLLGDYPSNYGPEGSPPHNLGEPKEKLKKIPSIFDIQVYPPGQGPPPRMLSPRPPVSSAGPQGPGMGIRPRFYSDINNPGPGMPGPRGPGGPGLMGPPPGPGPMMMGPGPGPMRMGPPGFFPGNFNIRPGLDPALAMELVKKLQEKEREQQEQAAITPIESTGDVDLRQFDPKMLAGMIQSEQSGSSGHGEGGNPGNKTLQDVAATLPPAQRELFLRIQQQQREHTVNLQEDNQGKKDEEDDNWYSSDEEDTKTSKTKLTEILKTIGQPVNAASQSPLAPQSGQMNIAQMLTAIRNSGPAEAKPDPRTARSDPRSTNKMATVEIRDHSEISELDLEIEATGVKLHYTLRLCTVDGRPSVPTHVDLTDPKFKDDPRIEKYYKAPKTVSKPARTQTSVVTCRTSVADPRASLAVPKPSAVDPRSNMADNRPAGSDPRARKGFDPRLGKADTMPAKPNDTRTRLLESLTTGVMGGNSPPSNPRMIKTMSAPAPSVQDLPQLSELVPPKVASPPRVPLPELLQEGHKPELPDLLKEWKKPADQVPVRRDSGSGSDSNTGQEITGSRRRPSLDYRNDPRFKKKKSGPTGILNSGQDAQGDSSSAQEDMEMQNENDIDMPVEDRSLLRERGLQHASPLAGGGASNKMGSLSGYNRPPNEKFSQLQEQNKSLGPRAGRNKGKQSAQASSFQPSVDSQVTPSFQPENPLTPILPEQMQAPPMSGLSFMPAPEDVPLKEVFKTIDPTASPFC